MVIILCPILEKNVSVQSCKSLTNARPARDHPHIMPYLDLPEKVWNSAWWRWSRLFEWHRFFVEYRFA